MGKRVKIPPIAIFARMGPRELVLIFLILFAIGACVELALNLLNRREALRHTSIPPLFSGAAFGGRLDQAGFLRSRAYTLERLAFERVSAFWSAAVTLGLLFSGLLPALDSLLARAVGDGLTRGALFFAAVAAIPSLLGLPFTAWSTFRIEGRYGFNTMTWGLFWRDLLRGLALSAALGLPLLYAVMAFLRFTGAAWWLWAFAFVLAYQILLVALYPLLIAPLFNRFQPLADGELRSGLLALAHSLDFPAAGIFVMDGSRRSLHSNAYFTGFGRFRRIVLYDTLLRQMDRAELEGVLAHEIGHYKRRHILKRMVAQAIMLGATLWLASLALRQPALYQAFGFASAPTGAFAGPPAAGLYLFLTLFSALSLLTMPIQNLVSRRHEFEADAFAIAATGQSQAMQSALIKLSEKNLSNLTPHPWYSGFHYSHPTLAERLKALEPSPHPT